HYSRPVGEKTGERQVGLGLHGEAVQQHEGGAFPCVNAAQGADVPVSHDLHHVLTSQPVLSSTAARPMDRASAHDDAGKCFVAAVTVDQGPRPEAAWFVTASVGDGSPVLLPAIRAAAAVPRAPRPARSSVTLL